MIPNEGSKDQYGPIQQIKILKLDIGPMWVEVRTFPGQKEPGCTDQHLEVR